MKVRSVASLHRQLKVGTSIWSVLKTPKGFGLVSIAVIAKTLLIAVGPLLQLAVARTQNPAVPLAFVLWSICYKDGQETSTMSLADTGLAISSKTLIVTILSWHRSKSHLKNVKASACST